MIFALGDGFCARETCLIDEASDAAAGLLLRLAPWSPTLTARGVGAFLYDRVQEPGG